MNTSDNLHPALTGKSITAAGRPELIEVSRRRARTVEIGVGVVLGLLIWWPLLFLAVAFVVPTIAVAAILAAGVAAIAAPIRLLVRRVSVHHRAHRATVFLHRLRP